jgi:hypothetical protein
MATETQKNYRKQMRELQKELNNNSDTGFYSYIERDYIKSYYQKRKRKRIFISAGVIGILTLLWNSYAIYTWINPIYYSITGKTLPVIHKALDVQGKKHREIAEYLQSLKPGGDIHDKNLNYAIMNLNEVLQKQTDTSGYFADIAGYSEDVKKSILMVESITPPAKMREYHGMMLERLALCKDIFDEILRISNMNNENDINNCIQEIKSLINRYNETGKHSTQEMINVFESINMRYEFENGTIKCWWNR